MGPTLFNVFLNGLVDGIGCTFCKSMDGAESGVMLVAIAGRTSHSEGL